MQILLMILEKINSYTLYAYLLLGLLILIFLIRLLLNSKKLNKMEFKFGSPRLPLIAD